MCVCACVHTCARSRAVEKRSLLLARRLLTITLSTFVSSGNHSTAVNGAGGAYSLEQPALSLEDVRGTAASLLSGDPVSLDGVHADSEERVPERVCAGVCECASVTLASSAITGAQYQIPASAARSGSASQVPLQLHCPPEAKPPKSLKPSLLQQGLCLCISFYVQYFQEGPAHKF